MKSYLVAALAALGFAAVPTVALADAAVTTSDVNLRAGPGTNYPRIAVVRGGSSIEVHGCLRGYSWCDISVGYDRGWMSSRYIDRFYERRVYVPQPRYYQPPVVSFGFGYWDNYYRGRDFYRYRDRWQRDDGWRGPSYREEYRERRRAEERRDVRRERERERERAEWRREERRDDRRRERGDDRRYERRGDENRDYGRQPFCPRGQNCD